MVMFAQKATRKALSFSQVADWEEWSDCIKASLEFPQKWKERKEKITSLIQEHKDHRILIYGCGHGSIDYINTYIGNSFDFLVDDATGKQGKYIPSNVCKKIESLQDIASWEQKNKDKVGLVLLGVYKENETKVIDKCEKLLAGGGSIAYKSLYTPTNFDI